MRAGFLAAAAGGGAPGGVGDGDREQEHVRAQLADDAADLHVAGLHGRQRQHREPHGQEDQDAENNCRNEHPARQEREAQAGEIVDRRRAKTDEEVKKGAKGGTFQTHLEGPLAEYATGDELEDEEGSGPRWPVVQKRKGQIEGSAHQSSSENQPQTGELGTGGGSLDRCSAAHGVTIVGARGRVQVHSLQKPLAQ